MASTKEFCVQWTQTAADDLEAIINYIAEESIASAVQVFQKIKARAERLNSFPQRGRIIPELRAHGILTYRELIQRPWRILYRTPRCFMWVARNPAYPPRCRPS